MNDPLTLLGLATTPLELISFVFAVITVYLNIRQNHWGWLFAIISSATYGMVFFSSKLYGDMGLQVVFVVVSFWGWYQWLHGGTPGRALQVTRLNRRGWSCALFGWLVGYAVLAYFLKHYTDTDVPRADAFLTAGSLLGQLLLSRKKVENWVVWILVDILYVGLYLYKHLMLTAILYAVFVLMAAAGWRAWSRAGSAPAVDAMAFK